MTSKTLTVFRSGGVGVLQSVRNFLPGVLNGTDAAVAKETATFLPTTTGRSQIHAAVHYSKKQTGSSKMTIKMISYQVQTPRQQMLDSLVAGVDLDDAECTCKLCMYTKSLNLAPSKGDRVTVDSGDAKSAVVGTFVKRMADSDGILVDVSGSRCLIKSPKTVTWTPTERKQHVDLASIPSTQVCKKVSAFSTGLRVVFPEIKTIRDDPTTDSVISLELQAYVGGLSWSPAYTLILPAFPPVMDFDDKTELKQKVDTDVDASIKKPVMYTVALSGKAIVQTECDIDKTSVKLRLSFGQSPTVAYRAPDGRHDRGTNKGASAMAPRSTMIETKAMVSEDDAFDSGDQYDLQTTQSDADVIVHDIKDSVDIKQGATEVPLFQADNSPCMMFNGIAVRIPYWPSGASKTRSERTEIHSGIVIPKCPKAMSPGTIDIIQSQDGLAFKKHLGQGRIDEPVLENKPLVLTFAAAQRYACFVEHEAGKTKPYDRQTDHTPVTMWVIIKNLAADKSSASGLPTNAPFFIRFSNFDNIVPGTFKISDRDNDFWISQQQDGPYRVFKLYPKTTWTFKKTTKAFEFTYTALSKGEGEG